MLESPCYDRKTKQHCPKRYPGCAANCPDWDDYVEMREEEYKKRKHANRTYTGGYGFEHAKKNEKARARKRSMRHYRGIRDLDE